MAQSIKNGVYKCSSCGNIVEVLREGNGELNCCGMLMAPLEEKTLDQGLEKHVPIVEKIEGGFRVKVGETDHPMENDHYIMWIELIVGDRVYRRNLTPKDKPEVEFILPAEEASARAYCNLHGLWKSD